MDTNNIYLILFLFIVVVLFVLKNFSSKNLKHLFNNEHFTLDKNDDALFGYRASDFIFSDIKKKFVKPGKNIIDDALFSDVVLYQSDTDVNGILGLDRCHQKCTGRCVEYGITGDAHCFPKNDSDVIKNYKNKLIQTTTTINH